MQKIVITGPESSGKTVLTNWLAKEFNGIQVLEYARDYLDGISRPYTYEDLYQIAVGQIALEEQGAKLASDWLFCDSDLITLKIWSDDKFGRTDPRILKWIDQRKYDLYLLCKPDLPWEADPQRENPLDRDRLFSVYQQELDYYHKKYEIVQGDGDERKQLAKAYLLLNQSQ
jgi:NadR type nicotinamide-nucleotide adenylyltransferase